MGRNFLSLGASPSDVEPVDVEVSEWLPDIQALNSPGMSGAFNVIPNQLGYVPYKGLVLTPGLTLPAAAKGAVTVNTRTAGAKLYASTKNKLFEGTSVFTERYTTGTAVSDDFYWQFVQFGDQLVALRPELPIQVAQITAGGAFANLGGSPPRARCAARVGDFLVIGNLDGEPDVGAAQQPARIRWNGFNQISQPWITDPGTQADYNDMPAEGGAVIAITGREVGTVFQERMISRMTYVGLPSVFTIETVEEERGAISTNSVVDVGTSIFYISDEGFFLFNGTNSVPIGSNRVNRWFFERLNYEKRSLINGAVDYENECIRWAFPAGGSSLLSETIIYSYKENRWSHAGLTVEYMLPAFSLSPSLDSLSGNLDTDYPISFDTVVTGRPRLGGFNSEHVFGAFSGIPLAATLETAEATAPGGKRIFINKVMPLVDITTPGVTVQVAVRDQLMGGDLLYGTAISQEVTGECPVLAEGRYARFVINIPAGTLWSAAKGMTIWRKILGAF